MSSRSSPRNHSNLPAPPMALPMTPPHAHISRIRVFIFPSMHLKFSRWRCLDSKLLASEQQSTNQWVTSRMLRPFLLYSLWLQHIDKVASKLIGFKLPNTSHIVHARAIRRLKSFYSVLFIVWHLSSFPLGGGLDYWRPGLTGWVFSLRSSKSLNLNIHVNSALNEYPIYPLGSDDIP